MNAKEFALMIKSGIHPVVTFTKGIEELDGYTEAGMRARVASAEEKHNDMYVLKVDYSEFDEYNQQYESANYYDPKGNPTITARAAGFYKERDQIYVGISEELPFVVTESVSLKMFEMFQQSGSTDSYVEWLEKQGVNKDLAMLVNRLSRALKAVDPKSELPAQALDFLKRQGLEGSVLRIE